MIDIPLLFVNKPTWSNASGPPSIQYAIAPYQASQNASIQPVLRDRLALQPDIDLNQYHCRAVLDWVELRLDTTGKHQSVNIQRFAAKVLGDHGSSSSVFVWGSGRKVRYIGSQFILRVQQPEPCVLIPLCKQLYQKYLPGACSIAELQIAGMEVSVDFVVKGQQRLSPDTRNLLRWRMTELLRRHLKPHEVLTEEERCYPRFYSDATGKGSAVFFVETKKPKAFGNAYTEIMKLGLPMSVLGPLHRSSHNQAPVDTTSYIGEKNCPVMLRVMDKTTDRRHPDKEDVEQLPEQERRSRVEVTLQSDGDNVGGAAAVGVETIEDLFSFQFQKIRKPIFEFFLPTFNTGDEMADLPFSVKVTERGVFERSGVYGLDRTHRSIQQIRMARYRKREITDKPKALGSKGRLLSYVELNGKVDRALRKLSKDWKI